MHLGQRLTPPQDAAVAQTLLKPDIMDDANLDHDALKASIADLRARHRALDNEIVALSETGVTDQLKIARLKKEKLVIKDRMARLEDLFTPDIIA